MTYVLFGRLSEDLSPEDSLLDSSKGLLWRRKGGARLHRSFCNKNWGDRTSKDSVQFSRSFISDSLRPHGLQHSRLPWPSPTPKVYPNLCPSSQWCHPTISSSVIPFCPQSSPASGYFPVSWLFASGSQSIGASASVLPTNIQGWFPLGFTGLISLQSKGLSRVFSSTTIWKFLQHSVFFMVQLSHPYMTTGKTIALTRWTFVGPREF